MKALALTVLLTCTSASAEFLTGNALLARMNSDNPYDRAVASGYIMGAVDVGHNITHCAPPEVTLGQVSDMVRQALQAAPQVRHMGADSFVSYVLTKTWPCAKRPKGQEL